jgi:ATP-dependent Clp protease ATP-binding subunit ClpA
MQNLARREKSSASKRTDNVIELFAGVLPAQGESKYRMSLTVSAARAELANFEARLAAMGIGFQVSDEVLAKIATIGFDEKLGARPLQQSVELLIEFPVSKAVLKGKFVPGDVIYVGLKGNLIVFDHLKH